MHRAIVLLILALSMAPFASADEESAVMAIGREYTDKFYANEIGPLWGAMDEQMQAALGSQNRLQLFRGQVALTLGSEVELLSEEVSEIAGYGIYVRRATFEYSSQPIVLSFSFSDSGQISGFFVQPQREPAGSPYLDYETKAHLRLPFDGEWFVFWGGRTVEENYHAVVGDQRFAYDFLILRDGKSFDGDGNALEDYYCWGEPILAPASGTVSSILDGLPDMAPGDMDPSNPAGNHIVLDLGNDEYALFAHFMQESIVVSIGDEVAAGDPLGQCGNSGNTSEPHLHFHLQDSPNFGEGNGKPAFFSGYLSNGEPVERGEPRRGETISPAD